MPVSRALFIPLYHVSYSIPRRHSTANSPFSADPKYDELINDAANRVETWLDRAEKMLNFAETAKRRFELGTLDDKRDILAALGSNLSLLDRNLSVALTKPLELVGEVAPEVQALHKRLEPHHPIENIEAYEKSYAKNEKWGRWLKKVRTCLISQ